VVLIHPLYHVDPIVAVDVEDRSDRVAPFGHFGLTLLVLFLLLLAVNFPDQVLSLTADVLKIADCLAEVALLLANLFDEGVEA
jgi:hypothetical protein